MAEQLTQILLDAPTSPVTRMQIAKIGSGFKHARYGKFAITLEEVQAWQRNLDLLPGGRAPIDLDHSADRPQPFRNTEAAGWITSVDVTDGNPMATLEWTPTGRAAINEKRYLFFSPTFGPFTDEQGDVHPDVLSGGALTNKPFLNMPVITLASEDTIQRGLDADPAWRLYQLAIDGHLGEEVKTLAATTPQVRDEAVRSGTALPDGTYPIPDVAHLRSAITLAKSGHGDTDAATALIRRRAVELGATAVLKEMWPALQGPPRPLDSPAAMKVTPLIRRQLAVADTVDDPGVVAILKALGVAEDADESAVISHLERAAKPAETPKVLEVAAADAGKVLLDQAAFSELNQTVKSLAAAVADGQAAKKELHTAKFDRAWTEAVDGLRRLDNERATYEHFYELDAPGTLKLLADAPVLFNAAGRGTSDAAGVDVAKLDPRDPNYAYRKLDSEVRAKMKDKGAPESRYLEFFEAHVDGRSL